MEWIVGLAIVLGVLVAIGLMQGQRDHRAATNIEKRIRHLDNFEPTDVYVSTFNLAGVAIDSSRREILLADEATVRRFTMSSIISCEILEDDVRLAYVNRGSQLAGIAVGGILLGGVGAVIGGLSASKRSINNVSKVILRFMTDDFERPKHDIVLLDWSFSKKGLKRDGMLYRAALETAELWHGRVTAMMKAGESSDKATA